MQKAVVVDFDGTLVNVNSFEKFFVKLFICCLRNFHLKISIRLLFLIFLRKSRIISHAELKKRVLFLTENVDLKGFLKNFSEYLLLHKNDDVVRLAEEYQKCGYKIFLCTAAPAVYVNLFLKLSGVSFDDVACTETPIAGECWSENFGEQKLQTTQKLLKKHNAELSVSISDHHDDLPLFRYSKERNILLCPNAETIKILRSENVNFDVL